MALKKHDQFIKQSNDVAFDQSHTPGERAPHPGIYRCTNCGDEIAIAGGHVLPPQNHKQHTSTAPIRWQLIVYAVSQP